MSQLFTSILSDVAGLPSNIACKYNLEFTAFGQTSDLGHC